MKISLFLAATLFLCSCTVPGSEEFVSYEASLERARIAAEDVVNVYNEYDKALRRRGTSAGSFDPDLADAYVRATLTPYSAEIMEGFAAASVYTEVLARYAENDTQSLQNKDIETLRTSAASTALLVGQPEIAAQVTALVNATTVLVNASLSPQDRNDFVRSVNDGSKIVDDFFLELRTRTREMYSRALSATALNGGSRQKLADFQIMLASWVLLIDQTRSDLAALRNAVENPSLSKSVLSGLSESAVRIDAYARQIEAARKEIESVF